MANKLKQEIDPEIIAETVVKKISERESKKEKIMRDKRLRNTRLLLQNYHILKEHCAKIDDEIEEYADSVFDPYDIEIKSIMASKAKTRKMVWYIDEMILSYQRYCTRAGDAAKRRYEALTYYYINSTRPSSATLAFNLNVSERTVRRDLDDARREFSVFLFGIDSVEDLSNNDVQMLDRQCP